MRVIRAQDEHAVADPLEKVLQAMADTGLIERSNPAYVFPQIDPVKIAGLLLSEQVIADRR